MGNNDSLDTVLVTGGAGFIGSAYLRRYVKELPATRFVCLDALTYAGNLRNLAPVWQRPNFRFVHGSVTNSELVAHLFRTHRFQCIIHFAAESHVDRSIKEETVFVETNVLGTQVVLRQARRFGARLVLVSTDEVYGDLGPDDAPFTEEHPLRPSSPYSASKAAGDLLALAAHRTFGTDVVITRCSNNYGPYQFPEKLIPLMVLRALDGQPLPVYGDGLNVRDWIHVEDHISGVHLAALRGESGETYNLGAACEKRNIDVVEKVLQQLGRPRSLIQFVTDRPGHDRRCAIDASRAEDRLGWRPERSFDEQLERTVDWYVERRGWCDEVVSGAYRRLTPQDLDEVEGAEANEE